MQQRRKEIEISSEMQFFRKTTNKVLSITSIHVIVVVVMVVVVVSAAKEKIIEHGAQVVHQPSRAMALPDWV